MFIYQIIAVLLGFLAFNLAVKLNGIFSKWLFGVLLFILFGFSAAVILQDTMTQAASEQYQLEAMHGAASVSYERFISSKIREWTMGGLFIPELAGVIVAYIEHRKSKGYQIAEACHTVSDQFLSPESGRVKWVVWAVVSILGFLFLFRMFAYFSSPSSYDECITKYIPKSGSDFATHILQRACISKHLEVRDVDYANCIFDTLPRVVVDASARVLARSCRSLHPEPPPPIRTDQAPKRDAFDDQLDDLIQRGVLSLKPGGAPKAAEE